MARRPRFSLPLPLAAAAVLTGALAAPALSARKPKTFNVKIGETPRFYFLRPTPAVPTLTIKRKDRVRWQWCPGVSGGCSAPHNVVVFSGGKVVYQRPGGATVDGGDGLMSGTASHTFTRAGTYKVECTIHGFAMKVKVRS